MVKYRKKLVSVWGAFMESKIINLTTAYEEKMDRNTPWSDYPRPSLVRDSFYCLNGLWDFSVCPDGEAPKYDKKILVPFSPESALSGYCNEIPVGMLMHYRRNFSLPEGFTCDRVILHFGAVDTICDVMINGEVVGHHEGGYLPFSFDITDFLKTENELCVKVRDDLDNIYPYGKQTRKRGGMWYTPVSGIWQTVWIESVPKDYVTAIKIDSDTRSAKITVLGGVEAKKLTIHETGEVFDFIGDTITLTPKDIKLWSPESPFLYNFTLKSGEDEVVGYFALRKIDIQEFYGIPRICLNGEPYLFNGLLDQGYFPDGLFLPATSEGFSDDILMVKRLGFNTLRKHIKVEPEIFYHLCDKLGVVVFQDMVNNSDYSFFRDTALPTVGLRGLSDKNLHKNKKSREIFERDMRETIEHLNRFPSVLYYTVFNEGWGQFSADEMYEVAKECAPSRIIDATSGWFVQKKSDVDSRHVYFKPVKLGKVGKRPIVISEFGGYSHRVEGHLSSPDNYGYKLYETMDEFEAGFRNLYENEILPLIPKGVSALIYTQVSDVEDETNGLVTYDRRVVKVSESYTKKMMEKLSDSIKHTENIK